MKLLLVLLVCTVVAAAPNVNKVDIPQLAELQNESPQSRNILVNALIRQLIAYLRRIINNGSDIFGIPPLDPLELDHYHLVIPAGLINLDLDLKNIHVSGIGGFIMNKSDLNLSELSFDIDITVPTLVIRADEYDLIGDLFTAIPLYGKGKASFIVEGFRFAAKLMLKQSDDLQSVLVDRVENPEFVIPSLKTELTGAIGGGDIDAIVNAVVDETIFNYIHRFRGAIAQLVGSYTPAALNPLLGQLDTWKYISPLLPRA